MRYASAPITLIGTCVALSAFCQTNSPISGLQTIASQGWLVKAAQVAGQKPVSNKAGKQANREWQRQLKITVQPLVKSVTKSQLASRLLKSGSAFANLVLIDRQGLSVAQARPAERYWYGNKRAWEVPFQKQQPYQGRMYVGKQAKKSRYQRVISVPVMSDSKAIGVLLAYQQPT